MILARRPDDRLARELICPVFAVDAIVLPQPVERISLCLLLIRSSDLAQAPGWTIRHGGGLRGERASCSHQHSLRNMIVIFILFVI